MSTRAWILACLTSACAYKVVPPPNPSALAVWWKIVEACDGKKGNFDAWTFAVSHDSLLRVYSWPMGWLDAYGITDRGTHVITLSTLGAACPKIVRHEMLHAIDTLYDNTHPDSIYERCKGIVTPPYTDAHQC